MFRSSAQREVWHRQESISPAYGVSDSSSATLPWDPRGRNAGLKPEHCRCRNYSTPQRYRDRACQGSSGRMCGHKGRGFHLSNGNWGLAGGAPSRPPLSATISAAAPSFQPVSSFSITCVTKCGAKHLSLSLSLSGCCRRGALCVNHFIKRRRRRRFVTFSSSK
jgi:hypothetical protein